MFTKVVEKVTTLSSVGTERLDCKKIHQLFERLMPLGTMVAQLRALREEIIFRMVVRQSSGQAGRKAVPRFVM